MSRVDRVDRVDWVDKVDGANIQESGTLAALRDGLLPKLLSGEVRVGRGQSGQSGREGLSDE